MLLPPLLALSLSLAGKPGGDEALRAHLLTRMAEERVPGLALAYVDREGAAFSLALGDAGRGRPATVDTGFLLGSLSKGFTALAVLLLAEREALSLDDEVATHLPALRHTPLSAVTVRHLLAQESGLGTKVGLAEAGEDLEQALERLARVEPEGPPGAAYRYSNANYVILGALVERVSGRPFEAFLEEEVLAPLGMQRSAARPGRAEEPLAQGHGALFGFVVPLHPAFDAAAVPAGGVVSTARDLERWLAFHLGQPAAPLLSDEGRARLHPPPQARRYDNGWIGAPFHGRFVLAHAGATATFQSQLLVDVEEGWGVALLANVNSAYHEGVTAALVQEAASLLRAKAPPQRRGLRPASKGALALALFTLWLLRQLYKAARLGRWRDRALKARGWRALWRGAASPLVELAVVAALLVVLRGAALPPLPLLLEMQPDLALWLLAALVIELLFVVARLALLARGRQRAAVAGALSGSLCT